MELFRRFGEVGYKFVVSILTEWFVYKYYIYFSLEKQWVVLVLRICFYILQQVSNTSFALKKIHKKVCGKEFVHYENETIYG